MTEKLKAGFCISNLISNL